MATPEGQLADDPVCVYSHDFLPIPTRDHAEASFEPPKVWGVLRLLEWLLNLLFGLLTWLILLPFRMLLWPCSTCCEPAYEPQKCRPRPAVSIGHIPSLVSDLRSAFELGFTRRYSWRRQQLLGLQAMLQHESAAFEQAIVKDNKRPHSEWVMEQASLMSELRTMLASLRDWMQSEPRKSPLWMQPAQSSVVQEPLGVVLIIVPFNYPISLSLGPLAAALAAGNCVVIKPSEAAPVQSALLAKLITKYIDNACVAVVEGAVPETQVLLQQRYDKVLFTGSSRVAAIVAKTIADNFPLTPVVYELGGKSPVIIDLDADLKTAAQRIVQTKFANCGQTCIAPDYVLVHKEVHHEFVCELGAQIRLFYGDDPSSSADYARMINMASFERVKAYIAQGTVAAGGLTDPSELYISPTVLTDVFEGAAVLHEEIFGPVLPVLRVDSMVNAISFVNRRPKPLAVLMSCTAWSGGLFPHTGNPTH